LDVAGGRLERTVTRRRDSPPGRPRIPRLLSEPKRSHQMRLLYGCRSGGRYGEALKRVVRRFSASDEGMSIRRLWASISKFARCESWSLKGRDRIRPVKTFCSVGTRGRDRTRFLSRCGSAVSTISFRGGLRSRSSHLRLEASVANLFCVSFDSPGCFGFPCGRTYLRAGARLRGGGASPRNISPEARVVLLDDLRDGGRPNPNVRPPSVFGWRSERPSIPMGDRMGSARFGTSGCSPGMTIFRCPRGRWPRGQSGRRGEGELRPVAVDERGGCDGPPSSFFRQ